MPLRDILKKKERVANDDAPIPPSALPNANDFTFLRTDTNTLEVISPPAFEDDQQKVEQHEPSPRKSFGRFRKSPKVEPVDIASPPKEKKRLSELLVLKGKNRSASNSSSHLPTDLPEIPDAYSERGDQQEKEAQWEERATRLAGRSPRLPSGQPIPEVSKLSLEEKSSPTRSRSRPRSARSVSDAKSDVNIQEAIRLHEEGQLEDATEMFRKLAEQGNVLSQVLYGLSLRHGWGCKPDPERAVTYLSAAASNSAIIESEALKSGVKKGGAAKGELVLAIFELANCFRHGWGVAIDKVAARHYYETAANLGDTDAMNEAAWCYLEGFGGKKDKFKAAQLLRLAENNGAKTLGNTWIWKEKYDPK